MSLNLNTKIFSLIGKIPHYFLFLASIIVIGTIGVILINNISHTPKKIAVGKPNNSQNNSSQSSDAGASNQSYGSSLIPSQSTNFVSNLNSTKLTTAVQSSVSKNQTVSGSTIGSPSNLEVNDATNNAVALEWSSSTTPNVIYNVYRNEVYIGGTDDYTDNYFDSNLNPSTNYVYTVKAVLNAATSNASNSISVTTGSNQQVTVINSCTSPGESGNYILTANISGTSIPEKGGGSSTECLIFSGLSNFSLNCQGHTVYMDGDDASLLYIQNSSNFLIYNCNFVDSEPTETGDYFAMYMDTVNRGTVADNTMGTSNLTYGNNSTTYVSDSSRMVFAGNTFTTDYYLQNVSSNNYIGNNHLTWDDMSYKANPSSISSGDGSDNTIDANNIDGGDVNYTEQQNEDGTDDGIVLGGVAPSTSENEADDIAVGNTISNVFDAGIEGVGYLNGNIIKSNDITNPGIAGISSYWYTSWLDNQVLDNSLTTTLADVPLIFIDDIVSVPNGDTYYFTGNSFIDNTFNPATNNFTNGIGISLAQSGYSTGFNIFSGNQLSHSPNMYAPFFAPESLAEDGGGNVCVTQESFSNSNPLTCH